MVMDSADKANDGGKPAAGGAPAPPAPLPPMTLPPPPKSARATGDGKDGGASAAPGMADLGAAIVDDGDLIEKEWVTRARHIVTSNRNDPHKQSEQMAVLRAEYMKKRYGKDIKLDK